MSSTLAAVRSAVAAVEKHRHILWALLMREMATRYGRDNIGFLWVIAEPIIFGSAVSTLYSFIRPPFDAGIRVVAFTITGYMPMILFRQSVNYAVSSVRSNTGLLYHRQISPMHLFLARFLMEFCGVTLAYIFIVLFANFLGKIDMPKDMLYLTTGWIILALQACGVAMVMNALSEIFDVVERFVQVFTYIFIPISGFMFLVYTLPPKLQQWALMVPFVHCFEMMRGGYFGEFLPVHFNVSYAMAWALGFNAIGLLLMQFVRPKVEVI